MQAADSSIPRGAGFGIRFLARFIDLAYGTVLSMFAGFFAGIIFAVLNHFGKLAPDWLERLNQKSGLDYLFGIVGFFLYHAFAEGIGTVTVGKAICRLRVVQIDGSPATLGGALIRDLGYHIDALFFGLVGYHSMSKGRLQQRYGDVWGETVVVRKTDFQPNPPRSGWRMTSGILLGSFLLCCMLALDWVLKVT